METLPRHSPNRPPRRRIPRPGPSAPIRRSPFPTTLALLFLPCALPACAPTGDAPPLAVQRDSAGIAIVESFAPAWGDSAQWRVDPEPLLDLAESGDGDAHNFYGVRSVVRLPDGGTAVLNRGSNEIRSYSAEGAFVGSAGGYGEGPGEFSNPQQLELAGDSLLARDIYGRVSLFGPGLRHLRTMQLEPRLLLRDLRYLGNGTMVASAVVNYPEHLGVVRAPEALLLYDLAGARVDSIGHSPGSEEYVTEALSASPLFGKAAVLDTEGDRIFVGSSDRMQIEELDATGDTVRIVRIPNYPIALTPEEVEAERRVRLNPPLPPGVESLPPFFVEAVEGMPTPETRPAYSVLIVDATGAIWLRPFRGIGEGGGAVDWIVFDADGRWLGSVEIPENFLVREIGANEILGVRIDELDVQHPQALRLIR